MTQQQKTHHDFLLVTVKLSTSLSHGCHAERAQAYSLTIHALFAQQAAAVVAGAVALAASPVMADAPEPWQWGFQDSATSTMQVTVGLLDV